MNKLSIDIRLIIGLVIAHLLMYYTFQNKSIFWYMFTATMLLLMSYAIFHLKTDNTCSFLTYSFYGIISGIILFALFWLGNFLIEFFHIPVVGSEISKLYRNFSPKQIWHYIVLFLFIIPGEELFWRGFVQKRLTATKLDIKYSVILAALLYASVQLYSGYFIHFFAALVAGVFWGFLYAWKRNMPIIIISHLLFDLFIFILFPFR